VNEHTLFSILVWNLSGCEMNQFSRVLVTGGAGFVGNYLVNKNL
jgi:hypothetical protein